MPEGGYIDKMGRKQYQASFAGYFPSERPKYSCIVVLYTKRTLGTYYGGTWAGPVFKKVADAMYASGIDWSEPLIASGESRLEAMSVRTAPAGKGKLPEGTVPDVQGMGLRDALYLLENEGYRVTFNGGGKVRQQTPEAGTKLGRGGQVEIILE